MLSDKLGFDIVLLDCMDMDMEEVFYDNENVLPIKLIYKFYEKYPEVPKYYVQKNVSDFLDVIRTRKWCERTEHLFIDTSYGRPEHGEMSAYCKRCGYSFRHQLY